MCLLKILIDKEEVLRLLDEASEGLAAATMYGAGNWSRLIEELDLMYNHIKGEDYEV